MAVPDHVDGGIPLSEPARDPRAPSNDLPVGQDIGGEVDSDLESEERDDSGPLPGDEDMGDGKTTENESVDSDMSYLALLREAGVPATFIDKLDDIEALLKLPPYYA